MGIDQTGDNRPSQKEVSPTAGLWQTLGLEGFKDRLVARIGLTLQLRREDRFDSDQARGGSRSLQALEGGVTRRLRIDEVSLAESDGRIQAYLNSAEALSRFTRPLTLPFQVIDLNARLRRRHLAIDRDPDPDGAA